VVDRSDVGTPGIGQLSETITQPKEQHLALQLVRAGAARGERRGDLSESASRNRRSSCRVKAGSTRSVGSSDGSRLLTQDALEAKLKFLSEARFVDPVSSSLSDSSPHMFVEHGSLLSNARRASLSCFSRRSLRK